MDIRKIALYLSWKLPPYYGNSKRLVFIRQLRTIAPAQYTNEEISFIDQQTRNDDEKFFVEILEDQKQSSEEIFDKIIEGLGLPDEVIWIIASEQVESQGAKKEKANPDKVLNAYIHPELNSIFASAMNMSKYDGMAFEAIKTINERLHDYAQKKWLRNIRENDAVNQLFNLTDNVFWFDLTSDTWNSQKQGLQNLLNGLFSYFRNPVGHEKDFIETKTQFIELIMFISMLLYVLDAKKIK